MTVLETLKYMGERVRIAMVIGAVPTDKSGEISILYANHPATTLFGYRTSEELEGRDVKTLMPKDISDHHDGYVKKYTDREAHGGVIRQGSIMGSWRDLTAVKANGETVPVKANVADIKNSEERYFLALFIDRSEEVKRSQELEKAVQELEAQKIELEESRKVAEALQKSAEDKLLKEKRLSGQITLLRQIFLGTVGLVAMLGALIIASWVTGNAESKDALAMIERVLLVMTGILGSAMASVFDSRKKEEG